MKQQFDLAIPATIYRVTQLEKKINEINLRIDSTSNAIKTQLDLIRSCMVIKEALPTKEGKPLPDIIVPEDLTMKRGKRFKKGKKYFTASKNRQAEIVARRWALWRDQHNAGMPLSVIARAWGCHHSTILNARKNNWESYKTYSKNRRVNKNRLMKKESIINSITENVAKKLIENAISGEIK